MLECSRRAPNIEVKAEDGDGDSEAESDLRLPASSDDPPSAEKSDGEDDSERGDYTPPGVSDVREAPSPLIDDVVPPAEPTLHDGTRPPLIAADPTFPEYESHGDASVGPSRRLSYDNLATQDLGCLCAVVGSDDTASALLALAVEDTMSAVRCLPADLSVQLRCEALGRIRTLNTYMWWVDSCQYFVKVDAF